MPGCEPDATTGDYIYGFLTVKGRCYISDCGGETVLRHIIAGKLKPEEGIGPILHRKLFSDGSIGVGLIMRTENPVSISDIGLYYIARISCIECGLFEQESCKTMVESEKMVNNALDKIGRMDLHE